MASWNPRSIDGGRSIDVQAKAKGKAAAVVVLLCHRATVACLTESLGDAEAVHARPRQSRKGLRLAARGPRATVSVSPC